MTDSKKAHLRRCAASFVTAAYLKVRLIPQDLRALHMGFLQSRPLHGFLRGFQTKGEKNVDISTH